MKIPPNTNYIFFFYIQKQEYVNNSFYFIRHEKSYFSGLAFPRDIVLLTYTEGKSVKRA